MSDDKRGEKFREALTENGFVLSSKGSKDGSGKATISYTGNLNDIVWGIIYDINEDEKYRLDKAEALGYGYNEDMLDVNIDEDLVKCQTYIASDNYLDDSLLPHKWYKDYIVNGAKQFKLPKKYIKTLEKLETKLK